MCDTRNEHYYWPMIWNDDVNIIITGSIYECKSFEMIDIRENKWNVYAQNEDESFDKIFGEKLELKVIILVY